ncbi:nicotinate phosphoribosyltransferase [Mycobacterium nebraskense]|uniref:Nicotinate phosphoribosyltransferase n=1 Tax=Mycobacterium nebraskense TaxID=244292 RepID=A0A0F5N4R6_9MYCO|nr:nicotinate phosphoribosyltransferase [Mycobacterium nebraskense]KKC01942.1 nicotinate phosphoribosyltransferase [Mycobacterium nebraskense]KLO45679.1 nicotinate phosphoribosyltransferase [Mycobacterium nebraskense]MBI2695030.1 nicotinate phosphoribosyltransferase [Mycobacterium nebraskense]MCV7115802.1 nicotinate phosphoribosyltransferase [Mycobacterium nebraskense]ORW22341.1 nicotinate phosphoribosyltransferase [Mycobacterium nebraskense]
MNDPVVTGLLTDKYELTMLAAALRDGTANRPTTFELFARRLPEGRRYGVVCGTGRLLEALPQFGFDDEACELLAQFLDPDALRYLRDFRFRGDIDGYAEGELYFPGSPVLSVTGTFAECVVLETLALSILNHDTAVASAAARMVSAARGRPLIEMGSRRTHEHAAVAAARAAYIAGFTASSNLEAQRRYGIPAEGTSAHAFTMLHASEEPAEVTELAAFRAQVDALGVDTTLLVDTYDVTTGVANAVAAAGKSLGAVRIDSGELGVLTRQVREQLDRLGATRTRIVVSGDLDEFSIAALGAEPVDSYGVGTSLVTGSGAPTANMVYKLVEVDGMPVQKRSSHKETRGGRKEALRLTRTSGTVTEEVVYPVGRRPTVSEPSRVLTVPLVSGGEVVSKPNVAAARELVASGLRSLPWEGLNLSQGEPAIPTTLIPAGRR